MRIKSITIEGMHNVLEKTYTFNQLNYLYGPNGAGKSTALQAIQLALLGYIPGVNKKNEAIFKHARSKTLSVTCVLDSNGTDVKIVRTWAGTGKTVTKAVDISPEGFDMLSILSDIELPVYNFSSFMGMTANQLKEWFISFLPNEAAEIDWEAKFKKALGDTKIIDTSLLSKVLQDISELTSTGVDLIKDVNSYLKEQQTLQKGNLQRSQATLESLILYEDCDEDDVAGVTAKINKLQQDLAKASRIEQVKANNRMINERLAGIHTNAETLQDDKEYNNLFSEIQDKQNAYMQLNQEVNKLKADLANHDKAIASKQAVISSKGVCPYTKNECESIKQLVADMEAEVVELQTESDKISSEIVEKNHEMADIKREADELSKKQASIAGFYRSRDELRSHLQVEELIDGEEKSVESIQAEIHKLQDTLTKASANKAYNDMADSLTTEKFKIENTIQVLKIWTKLTDANNMQTEVMKTPFESMATDMDTYLHKMFGRDDIITKFHLSEKANSFTFGIQREDKYISFDMLSSGEKCMYTLALMMCIVKRAKCPLKVIMIDDLLDHLDDANANQLFKALESVDDIQLILAGVKKYESDNQGDVLIEVK